MLCDRWSSCIPASVAQKLRLGSEVSDVDAPPAFVLFNEECLECRGFSTDCEDLCSQRFAEVRYDGISPHVHESAVIEVHAGDPSALRFSETPCGDKNMKMCVEGKMAPERMRHDHNHHASTIPSLHPLLNYRGSEGRQVVQKMPILLEEWPQNIGHGQTDAHIRNIG